MTGQGPPSGLCSVLLSPQPLPFPLSIYASPSHGLGGLDWEVLCLYGIFLKGRLGGSKGREAYLGVLTPQTRLEGKLKWKYA